MSVGTSVKRRLVDLYLRRLIPRAGKSDPPTSDQGVTVRVEVLEVGSRKEGRALRTVATRMFRVQAGRLEELPEGTAPRG
jgi:hypothetical protein